MHPGVEGKQTPHRAKGLCCHETKWSEDDRAQQRSHFFPSNAFMASARSLHTFYRSKRWIEINVQGCQYSIATKVLVMDLYAVQYAIPARKHKTNHKNKQANPTNKTTQKTSNKTKNSKPRKNKTTKRTPRSGIATSNGDSCMMTSCVSWW